MIGIIGGKGLMGKFFAKFFRKNGFRVLVSDKNTKLKNKELVKKSDIVFFSVPIDVTEKVIRSILPCTRKNQLLLDCTSLKTKPVKAMLKGKASVIGLHPMFRPGPSGFREQTIVMCPARCTLQEKNRLKKLFRRASARVIEMAPQKHDQLMAIVQVLVHFNSMVFGGSLRSLRCNLRDITKVMSPVYRIQFDVVCRIFAQNPSLYAAIAMENPETRKIIKIFLHETSALARSILGRNLSGFQRRFRDTARYLGPFSRKALRESDRLIKNLTM